MVHRMTFSQLNGKTKIDVFLGDGRKTVWCVFWKEAKELEKRSNFFSKYESPSVPLCFSPHPVLL